MIDNEEDHFLGKVAQKALIVNGDSVLLVRHAGSREVWELPGGRLHKDEDPKAGLQREITEELGVSIEVGGVILVEQFIMKRTGECHLALVYLASLVGEVDMAVDPNEVAEVAWVTGKNWKAYQLFGNYERALERYFANFR